MAESKNNFENMGLVVSGMVTETSEYTHKESGVVYHSVHLFTGKSIIKISIPHPSPERFAQGKPVKMEIKIREFNGKFGGFEEVV